MNSIRVIADADGNAIIAMVKSNNFFLFDCQYIRFYIDQYTTQSHLYGILRWKRRIFQVTLKMY